MRKLMTAWGYWFHKFGENPKKYYEKLAVAMMNEYKDYCIKDEPPLLKTEALVQEYKDYCIEMEKTNEFKRDFIKDSFDKLEKSNEILNKINEILEAYFKDYAMQNEKEK